LPDQTPASVILEATKTGELVQVNMTEIKSQVADQMRAFLLNMLPKEAFDKIIETVWTRLTQPREEKVRDGHYGQERTVTKPSELEEMVTNQMRAVLLARVKEWGERWAARDSEDIDDALLVSFRELANECAKTHLQSVGDSIVSRTLALLQNQRACGSCSRIGQAGESCVCGAHIPY